MSTKAIREALVRLEILMEEPPAGMSVEDAVLLNSARTEVEAIERAAKAMSELNAGDFVYNIRDRFAGDHEYMGDSWEHPAVKAWADASALLANISRQES